LQMTTLEHQVRFSNLHEKRAEVIADLYKRFVELSWQTTVFVRISDLLTDRPPVRQTYNDVVGKIDELRIFVETNRIYVPAHTGRLIDSFITRMLLTVDEVKAHGRTEKDDPLRVAKIDEFFKKAYEVVEEDLPDLKEQLETEFRTILGEKLDAPT